MDFGDLDFDVDLNFGLDTSDSVRLSTLEGRKVEEYHKKFQKKDERLINRLKLGLKPLESFNDNTKSHQSTSTFGTFGRKLDYVAVKKDEAKEDGTCRNSFVSTPIQIRGKRKDQKKYEVKNYTDVFYPNVTDPKILDLVEEEIKMKMLSKRPKVDFGNMYPQECISEPVIIRGKRGGMNTNYSYVHSNGKLVRSKK